MKKRNLYLLGSVLIVVVAIAIVLFAYSRNNYAGDNVDRYTGKWELTEQWQNGEQVGEGFGDTFLEIAGKSTVKYTDSHESYEAEIRAEVEKLTFTNEEGYKYILSIKKGYLMLNAQNARDQKDPGGLLIYKKIS